MYIDTAAKTDEIMFNVHILRYAKPKETNSLLTYSNATTYKMIIYFTVLLRLAKLITLLFYFLIFNVIVISSWIR